MLSQRSIFGIGLVILSIISAASIGLDIKSRLDAGWIDETVDLLRRLSDIRLLVRDAESAATGYALQSDIRLADEYRASLQRVAPSFAELKQRIKDSPETAELVAATETLVNRRLAATSEGVARQSAGDTAGLAEMIRSLRGHDPMRTINANFDRLLADQRRRLDDRIGDSQGTRVVLLGINVSGAMLILLFAGTTEILVAQLKDQPELQKTAGLIDQAADRCSELIEQLLGFARQQPLQPRTVDINRTVLELAKLLRPTLGEQIEIKTVLQGDLALSHIDPSQLAHSLLNLVINARDAMPNGGRPCSRPAIQGSTRPTRTTQHEPMPVVQCIAPCRHVDPARPVWFHG